MNLAQRTLIMNAFIFLQFGYCPLAWLFHSKKVNNCISNIYESTLRIVFRDYESIFQQFLKQNKPGSIHIRNLQIFVTKIFETNNGLNPVILMILFKFKNSTYNFVNAQTLNRSNVILSNMELKE